MHAHNMRAKHIHRPPSGHAHTQTHTHTRKRTHTHIYTHTTLFSPAPRPRRLWAVVKAVIQLVLMDGSDPSVQQFVQLLLALAAIAFVKWLWDR